MIRSRQFYVIACVAISLVMIDLPRGFAQGNLPMATTGDHVAIKREACRVIDAHKYRVPLATEAIQTVTLVAPFDGTIKQIVAKTNAKIQPQSEVVRLDNAVQKLHFAHAQATLKLAALEHSCPVRGGSPTDSGDRGAVRQGWRSDRRRGR
jgi:hypothetical protein